MAMSLCLNLPELTATTGHTGHTASPGKSEFAHTKDSSIAAVMAMAMSYNWLFQWDYTFYKWGYKYL